MLKQLIATAAALMVSTGVAQARQSDEIAMLKVGDPAPKLTNVTWVQGEPVSDYQSGQVYVLDFWATWCGPCKASIPHMNDLHKKHQKDGVNVIGLAIWPRPNMVPTAEFVKEKGDDMGYRIAEDVDGKSAEMFMKATGQNGIPTVMVVDKAGKLAWIGYPMGPDAEEMDATINRLIANTFDLSAATSKYEVKLKKEKKVNDARRQLTKALNAKNFDEALFMMDSMLAEHPEDLAMLAVLKYQILLVEKNDPASAGNWGRQAIAGVI
ncbi:MAG TPA: TlpA disulfide reductase family protein, partial [Phycisphaerales bacterium]|nr:TlpA disulfide reductase family protein [Phycisphaerales bacterium]